MRRDRFFSLSNMWSPFYAHFPERGCPPNRVKSSHGGQPLGDLLWWELAVPSVSHLDLVKLWVAAGLPTELLPEKPTVEKAFKTAAWEMHLDHPERFFRLAVENEQKLVIGIVNELRDGNGGLIYVQEARVTLQRQVGKLVSDQPRQDLVVQLARRFEALKTLHTTDDIRHTITRTLESFAAVALRHMGGVYWVPAQHGSALRQLQAVIERLGQSKMYLVPITATNEGQGCARWHRISINRKGKPCRPN
jgi:hypothetical protein